MFLNSVCKHFHICLYMLVHMAKLSELIVFAVWSASQFRYSIKTEPMSKFASTQILIRQIVWGKKTNWSRINPLFNFQRLYLESLASIHHAAEYQTHMRLVLWVYGGFQPTFEFMNCFWIPRMKLKMKIWYDVGGRHIWEKRQTLPQSVFLAASTFGLLAELQNVRDMGELKSM